MTLDEYQKAAVRTATRQRDAFPAPVQVALNCLEDTGIGSAGLERSLNQLIWTCGLTGEAGEVADLIKKAMGHGKLLDRDALRKELGDVLWYVAALADSFGLTLGEVARANVDKLKARHPKGFTVESANAKADEQPACRFCGGRGEVEHHHNGDWMECWHCDGKGA